MTGMLTAGSTSTGDYVVIAGQSGIADHVTIGEKSIVGPNSGIFQDIPANAHYLGSPARPERDAKRYHLAIERLPELRRQVIEIRRKLGLDGRADDGAGERRAAG